MIVVMYNVDQSTCRSCLERSSQGRSIPIRPSSAPIWDTSDLSSGSWLEHDTAIFISGTVIRKLSIGRPARSLVPDPLAITGIGFFFVFVISRLQSLASLRNPGIGSTPLALGVFFGSMQNCIARAFKYTFFDATKELAFIPLSKECKLKGKAAIDGVGSRLGKSGGSIVHQVLLLSFGTVASSTPYVGVILFGTVSAWILAVRALGKRFNQVTQENATIQISDTEPAPLFDEKAPQQQAPSPS